MRLELEGRRTTCRCWSATCGTGSWPRRCRPRRGGSAAAARAAREAPEAYDDDFAFDEGVAEFQGRGSSARGRAPNLEGGSFGGVSLKGRRAAAWAGAGRAAAAGRRAVRAYAPSGSPCSEKRRPGRRLSPGGPPYE